MTYDPVPENRASPDELLSLCRRLYEILDDGFLRRGGSDVTDWGECHVCARADWNGHADDCTLGKLMEDAHKLLEGKP